MSAKLQFDKDGITINNEKTFPLCAEFHYWRMDPRWWDDVLNRLIKGAGLDLVASYVPWSIHETIKGDFDFTGRRNPRANIKGFLDLVHKNGLYFFARSGPAIYGEIDGGGPTDYANITGGRSKRFIELTEEWIEAISTVWKEYSIHNGGPVIYVQVDNEICPVDTWWQEFLQQRYPDVEALNLAWDSRFADFEEAAADQTFFRGKKDMIGGVNWKSALDVMEYKTRTFPVTYGGTLAKMFRKHGTDVPMMLNNTFLFLQDWFSMQEAPEIISGGLDHYAYYLIPGDSYYWDYLYVSLNSSTCHFPWSPEFQCGSGMMMFGPTPSQHQKLVTLFSLAAGMVGMNYYMFVERERWEGYCPVT
ncbi:MAG: beta-galactosidase, partial [Candidatus Latescibacteria bacterium]|nr:beta-galactosidase [Candidatus Latescibacterota bacterium]